MKKQAKQSSSVSKQREHSKQATRKKNMDKSFADSVGGAMKLTNQITHDYQGNPVMVGIDYRNTSLHDKRGITLVKQLGREKDELPFTYN